MSEIYKSMFGHEFRFNDPVKITCVMLPESECIGRLIQVRKACGAYGSDILIIRLPDGGLRTFENVGVQKYTEAELPVYKNSSDESDSVETEYTIKGQWGETGFLIEQPKQPESYSPPFAITIQQQATE